MTRRLMEMRLLDSARLFGRWWRVAIDGTLQDRGRDTPEKEARYRYVVAARSALAVYWARRESIGDPMAAKPRRNAQCETFRAQLSMNVES